MHAAISSILPLSHSQARSAFGFGHARHCRSAKAEGGGDVCEVIQLSNKTLLLVIADVMGKGLSAALHAESLRTLVRALATLHLDPAECLSQINELMFEGLSRSDRFITAQLVVANLETRHLVIAGAGHCPALISDGVHRTEAIPSLAMPLGVERNAEFFNESISLEPYSSLLLYSDGITESRNPSGRLYGQARLERWFRGAVANHVCADQMKESLLQEINCFRENTVSQDDDQSFLLLSDETPRPVLSSIGLRCFLGGKRVKTSQVEVALSE